MKYCGYRVYGLIIRCFEGYLLFVKCLRFTHIGVGSSCAKGFRVLRLEDYALGVWGLKSVSITVCT